jgi:DNA modification methylase
LDNMQEKKVNDGRKKENDTAFQRGATLRKNSHPTVKSIKLMAYLITMGSRENDIVLDPFAGSASTCIAAKLLNRNYIGIEILPKHHKGAVRKLENIDSDNTMKKIIHEAFKDVKDVSPKKNKSHQNQKKIKKILCGIVSP